VIGALLFTGGAAFHQVGLLYAGAVVQGCAYAGGALAWNLGHVDFSPPSQTSQYMATHVTLNGLRGLIAPIFSVMLFETFKAWQWPAATMLFAMGMLVNAAGAVGFVMLRRSMGAEASRVSRGN
jgi:hypothetical protein